MHANYFMDSEYEEEEEDCKQEEAKN